MSTRQELDAIYDASLETFRVASRAFREVTTRYRAREIGDDEYLTARRAFYAARDAADLAEKTYIDGCNVLGSDIFAGPRWTEIE